MEQTSKAVKTAVAVYRIVTVLNLVLTVVLYIYSTGSSLPRTVAFMVWLALGVYSLIRVVSDALSGQRKKEKNFENTLSLWKQNTGDQAAATRSFFLTAVGASLLKLVVPVVLWFIFR